MTERPTPELQQKFEAAVAFFGGDATETALANVYLFHRLRARSRRALTRAGARWRSGIETQLAIRLQPATSKAGERIEILAHEVLDADEPVRPG